MHDPVTLDRCAKAARLAILGDSILPISPWDTCIPEVKAHFHDVAQAVLDELDRIQQEAGQQTQDWIRATVAQIEPKPPIIWP